MALRVLHLVGSPTSLFYRDLSRLYATDCLQATADTARYEPHVAYVTPDGRWRFPTDLSDDAIAAAPGMDVPAAMSHLDGLRVDVMVPQLFCVPGMTHYRALFDVLGVPFVGNTPAAMALTADKARAKAVVAAAGVDVPAGEVVRQGDAPTVMPPAVVKPADADNSLGVSLVREQAAFGGALRDAFAHGDRALVETYIEAGREVRCGLLVRDGELVPLPLEEYRVHAEDAPVRGYADKITRSGDGGLSLVAKDSPTAWIVDPDDPVNERVWAAARACHDALGCRHYSLFDFRIDPDGRPFFLEAGLYCSFARQSVIAVMAAAAGLPVDELFAVAIAEARR